MLQITITRVIGYRRSLREDNDAQLFAQSRTLRIRQSNSLDFSNVVPTSPLRTVTITSEKLEKERLREVLGKASDNCGDWMRAFVIGEILSNHYADEVTLAILARLAKTASLLTKQLLPQALERESDPPRRA